MKNRSNHGGNIYEEGLSKDVLDFSSNINPMELPESIYRALPEILNKAKAYPDIEYRELRNNIANYLNELVKNETIDSNMIVCGNGATELLEKIIAIYKKIIIPVPSFFEYERSANKANSEIIFLNKYEDANNELLKGNDLKNNDLSLYNRIQICIKESNADAVVLCNPNNPDGSKLDKKSMEGLIIDNPRVMFIIDETFGEYLDLDDMLLPLISKFENIIVIKALTKFFGLPGCRLGYSISKNNEINDRVMCSLPVWNINTFSQEIAILMFKEKDYINNSISENKVNKEYLLDNLKKIELFERVYDSSSDFIMVRCKKARELEKYLKKRGILIRNLSNMRGLDGNYIRIAVKTKEYTNNLIEQIKLFH